MLSENLKVVNLVSFSSTTTGFWTFTLCSLHLTWLHPDHSSKKDQQILIFVYALSICSHYFFFFFFFPIEENWCNQDENGTEFFSLTGQIYIQKFPLSHVPIKTHHIQMASQILSQVILKINYNKIKAENLIDSTVLSIIWNDWYRNHCLRNGISEKSTSNNFAHISFLFRSREFRINLIIEWISDNRSYNFL